MNIASAVIVGYMLFDFMPTQVVVPAEGTSFFKNGTGDLLVTLDNPQSIGSVARGATRVSLGTLNLTASCDGDITVQEIEVKHTGLGASSDIRGVYLIDGARRVSRPIRFDAGSKKALIRPMNLVVPKCGAIRPDIVIDLVDTAAPGAEHGISLTGVTGIKATAKSITVSESEASKRVLTTPYADSKITVNFLPGTYLHRYAHRETLARIQFTADAKSSHFLKKIILTNQEGARDYDVLDFALETTSGKRLTAPAMHMNGRTLTLEFYPSFELRRSQTVVLLLKGTINSSITKKIDFTVEEKGDLFSTPARER
jgi:hypothetical protein